MAQTWERFVLVILFLIVYFMTNGKSYIKVTKFGEFLGKFWFWQVMNFITLLIHNFDACELKIEVLSKENSCSLWKDLFEVVLHVQFKGLTFFLGFSGSNCGTLIPKIKKQLGSFGIHFHMLLIVCLNFKRFSWPTPIFMP
jgi:hypothetical protein